MTTGEKIQTIRNLCGLTRETMAERLHLSVQGYGKIERGEVKLEERLPQIAEALGVTKEFIESFERENLVIHITSNDTSTNSSTNQNALQIVTSDITALEILAKRLSHLESENEKLLVLLTTVQTQNNELLGQLFKHINP